MGTLCTVYSIIVPFNSPFICSVSVAQVCREVGGDRNASVLPLLLTPVSGDSPHGACIWDMVSCLMCCVS